MFLLSPISYAYISIDQTNKRTDYPGKEIANKVQEKWSQEFNLPINVEFSIHAASLAIQTLDRLELEEAFIELLHQKALDRQMFYDIMKDHGIDANIQFQLSTEGQIS